MCASEQQRSPLVSVIIPTYNRASLVLTAIDSALNQTHANVEVVVVDDGSTDQTDQLIAQKYANEPRLCFIRIENGGVAKARNVGIRASTGEYIAFLDSDDFWFPWKVELQLKCFELAPQAVMIWSDMTAVTDAGVSIHERYIRKMYCAYSRLDTLGIGLYSGEKIISPSSLGIAGLPDRVLLRFGDIYSQMVIGNLVHTSTCILRRHTMNLVSGFREELRFTGEDYDFHLRTCREGVVAFVDISTTGYMIGRSDQLTAPHLTMHMALNSLRTIELALAEGNRKIDLPEGVVRRVLASTHLWVASSALGSNRLSAARRHATKCILLDPRKLEAYLTLAAASIPRFMRVTLLSILRHLRRSLGAKTERRPRRSRL